MELNLEFPRGAYLAIKGGKGFNTFRGNKPRIEGTEHHTRAQKRGKEKKGYSEGRAEHHLATTRNNLLYTPGERKTLRGYKANDSTATPFCNKLSAKKKSLKASTAYVSEQTTEKEVRLGSEGNLSTAGIPNCISRQTTNRKGDS